MTHEEQGITLEQLLQSREDRWHRQMMLVSQHKELTLLCLTVIMPGSVKRNVRSLIVAEAAVEAVRREFGSAIRQLDTADLPTGYEAYFLLDMPLWEAKRTACLIEDTHPLGRLFDLDIIDPTATPVSRSSMGFQPRRCLLCEREARYCMRNHTHTQQQLDQRIDQLIESYVQRL